MSGPYGCINAKKSWERIVRMLRKREPWLHANGINLPKSFMRHLLSFTRLFFFYFIFFSHYLFFYFILTFFFSCPLVSFSFHTWDEANCRQSLTTLRDCHRARFTGKLFTQVLPFIKWRVAALSRGRNEMKNIF